MTLRTKSFLLCFSYVVYYIIYYSENKRYNIGKYYHYQQMHAYRDLCMRPERESVGIRQKDCYCTNEFNLKSTYTQSSMASLQPWREGWGENGVTT